MALSNRLESLEKKHQELEFTIHDLEKHPLPDEFAIKRLKIEKLAVKDEISQVSGRVLMDAAAE